MKIRLLVSPTDTRVVTLPAPGADHAVAEGCCPSCKTADFKIAGKGQRPSADDRAHEADGVCLACRKSVGLIRAEPDTLFGVREDEAVLHGRPRVY